MGLQPQSAVLVPAPGAPVAQAALTVQAAAAAEAPTAVPALPQAPSEQLLQAPPEQQLDLNEFLSEDNKVLAIVAQLRRQQTAPIVKVLEPHKTDHLLLPPPPLGAGAVQG